MSFATASATPRFRMRGCPSLLAVACLFWAGCHSPQTHRHRVDQAAYGIVDEHRAALSMADEGEFRIESPAGQLRRRLLLDQRLPTAFDASTGVRELAPIPELPENDYLEEALQQPAPSWCRRASADPLVVSLDEALQIAARNSRNYQRQKETVFRTALALDVERDAFRNTWEGILGADIAADLDSGDATAWTDPEGTLELVRRFKSGMRMTALLGVNLAKLLTGSEESSLGLFGDASIRIPLLRNAGRFVVTEPLRQAERDVAYALYEFERFKRTFAVDVAVRYLDVLEQRDRVRNAEENYRGLIASARRARRMADMGRISEIDVDQGVQQTLRARNRWISARQGRAASLDAFRMMLGLPVDAAVEPDPAELERLSGMYEWLKQNDIGENDGHDRTAADAPILLDAPTRDEGGPLEIAPARAVRIAFDNRLDLRVAIGRIDDSQRNIAVSANNLRADLALLGQVSVGDRRTRATAGEANADLRFDDGRYSAGVTATLPLERTKERADYRIRWIDLEQAVRNAQQLEDQIKLEVRGRLRDLLEAREAARIQRQSVEVARRQVRSTELFLQQGRAEMRDVLDARENLVSAENDLTAAVVQYRTAELAFQRDLGVLAVDADGLWREFEPTTDEDTGE